MMYSDYNYHNKENLDYQKSWNHYDYLEYQINLSHYINELNELNELNDLNEFDELNWSQDYLDNYYEHHRIQYKMSNNFNRQNLPNSPNSPNLSNNKKPCFPCFTLVSTGRCIYFNRCCYIHDERCYTHPFNKCIRRLYKRHNVIEDHDIFKWPKMPFDYIDNQKYYNVYEPKVEIGSNSYENSIWIHFLQMIANANKNHYVNLAPNTNIITGKQRLKCFIKLASSK